MNLPDGFVLVYVRRDLSHPSYVYTMIRREGGLKCPHISVPFQAKRPDVNEHIRTQLKLTHDTASYMYVDRGQLGWFGNDQFVADDAATKRELTELLVKQFVF